jgi:hypothetical protein
MTLQTTPRELDHGAEATSNAETTLGTANPLCASDANIDRPHGVKDSYRRVRHIFVPNFGAPRISPQRLPADRVK